MEKFDELSINPDLDFFGNGRDNIAIEKMMELKNENKIMLVDAKTKEKNEWIKLKIVVKMPAEVIPVRINEIPNDQTVALFHPTASRASSVYSCLQVLRYNDGKRSVDTSGETAEYIIPNYVLENHHDLTENRSKEVFE